MKRFKKRCVHCPSDAETMDHVFPRSWYPDTTPENIQRWTVPSCLKCNNDLSRIEKNLLILLGLCLDPHLPGASGIGERALRSLGIDAEGLSEEEKDHRDKARAKLQSQSMPYEQVATQQPKAMIQGLKAHEDTTAAPQSVVAIPYAELSIIAEKMARGCEYKLKRRYIELPYGLRTFVTNPQITPDFLNLAEAVNFGPGCKVLRANLPEDQNAVMYIIRLWETLAFKILIDFESVLLNAEPLFARPPGFTREQVAELKEKGQALQPTQR